MRCGAQRTIWSDWAEKRQYALGCALGTYCIYLYHQVRSNRIMGRYGQHRVTPSFGIISTLQFVSIGALALVLISCCSCSRCMLDYITDATKAPKWRRDQETVQFTQHSSAEAPTWLDESTTSHSHTCTLLMIQPDHVAATYMTVHQGPIHAAQVHSQCAGLNTAPHFPTRTHPSVPHHDQQRHDVCPQ